MSRRALPKLDKSIDLSSWLYSLEQLPLRPDPDAPAHDALAAAIEPTEPRGLLDTLALFGRAAPLEIEVGSGKGLFLRSAAAECPEHNFLGIEIARRYAEYIALRLARRGLDNARVIAGDGMRLFTGMLPPESVAAVHVYFPDPWWKKRHRKRRIMNEVFLKQVERVLIAGGKLHFWTDVQEYFESAVALVGEVTTLAGPLAVAEKSPEHDFDYRTHFERRMRQHGEAVYRSLFEKRANG